MATRGELTTWRNVCVFSEESILYLKSKGESTDVENSFYNLSMSALAPTLTDSPLGQERITIPIFLNSVATLEFCGLREDVAAELYLRWYDFSSNPMNPTPIVHIYDRALQYVETAWKSSEQAKALHKDNNWAWALHRLGLHQDCITRILDNDFDEIRLTRSAKEWAIDTICTAWKNLVFINERIQRLKDIDTGDIIDTSVAEPNLFPELYNQGVPSHLADTPNLLYKGGSIDFLLRGLGRTGRSALGIRNILSRGDFHPTESYLYFTKNLKLAIQEALYASHRVPLQQPGLMTLESSPELMMNVTPVLEPSWGELVKASRNESCRYKNGLNLPKELAELGKAPALMGLMGYAGNDHISEQEPGSFIKKRMVDGKYVMQYAFRFPDFYDKFDECVEEKIHFKLLQREEV